MSLLLIGIIADYYYYHYYYYYYYSWEYYISLYISPYALRQIVIIFPYILFYNDFIIHRYVIPFY